MTKKCNYAKFGDRIAKIAKKQSKKTSHGLFDVGLGAHGKFSRDPKKY